MNVIKKSSLLLLAVSSSLLAFSQQGATKSKTKEKNEQIIIRKNGDVKEKTTIVIDGDNITVNGKPLNEFEGKNITIRKMKGPQGALAFSMPDMDFRRLERPAMAGNKALLGVTTEKAEGGVKVNSVSSESGAAKAGLKENDVITRVGDKKIESPNDLVEVVGQHKPNDKVEIAYMRDGKMAKTTATLGENKARAFSLNLNDENFNFEIPERPLAPSLNGNMFSWNRRPKIGMQIQDVEEGKGVKVNEVEEDSPAAKSGFKEGDLITGINGKTIEGVDDLKAELRNMKEGDAYKIDYKRNGKQQTAEVKIPKKLKTADL